MIMPNPPFPQIGTIWNSECGIIDQRPNEQSDICGDYIDGSTVICNAGT